MFNRFKVFKKNARDILRERLVSVIIATLILITLSFGSLQILSIIAVLIGNAFSQEVTLSLLVFAFLIWIIAVCPIVNGYFSWMIALFNEEKVEISAIFDVFSSRKSISRAFRSGGFIVAYVFSVIIAVTYALLYGGQFSEMFASAQGSAGFVAASVLTALTNVVTYIICAFLVIIWLIFSPVVAFTEYAFITDNSLSHSDAILEGAKLSKGKKLEFIALNFSFILWYVLCFFTAGILFVTFVFPYHIFTVLGFMRYVTAQKTVSGTI